MRLSLEKQVIPKWGNLMDPRVFFIVVIIIISGCNDFTVRVDGLEGFPLECYIQVAID